MSTQKNENKTRIMYLSFVILKYCISLIFFASSVYLLIAVYYYIIFAG